MKTLQNVSIIVLAVIALLHVAYADSDMVDLTTGLPVEHGQVTKALPESEGLRQHEVLWDTTHGVYLYYSPFGIYTDLVAMLADSGFTMSACGTGVHTVDLTQYDVIVITVGSSWNSSYTSEEVDSLMSYYNQYNERVLLMGDMNFCDNTYWINSDNIEFSYNVFEWLAESGGILIMGDNPGCNNSNINPVANAFNMTAGVASLSPADLYFSNFAVHPIFDGIDTIYYRAAGEVAASSPAEPIAWTDSNQPTIALLDEFTGIVEDQTRTAGISRLTVKPNPFRYSAEIQGMSSSETIRIFDVSGRLVAEQQEKIIGQGLKEGVYFVRVHAYQTEKIIKLQ